MQVFDATASMGFAVNQTEQISKDVDRAQFPQIQYKLLTPVDSSAPDYIQSVSFTKIESFGEASFIQGDADDIPVVGLDFEQSEAKLVKSASLGYRFGTEEIQQAMMLRIDLTREKAMAARLGANQFVQKLAFTGSSAHNMQGLINYSGVAITPAITGNWAGGVTVAQILADCNAALLGTSTSTSNISIGDTLLLPFTEFGLLTTTITAFGQSAYDLLMQNNVYTARTGNPLVVRSLHELDGAGAGATNRMIAYRRSPEVLRLHYPMQHKFLPVRDSGSLNYIVPALLRIGGLEIRRTEELIYVDGI